MKKLLVTVNGDVVEVQLHPDGSCVIDGREVRPEFGRTNSERSFLVIDGKSYDVFHPDARGGREEQVLYVNGRAFTIEIDDEKSLLLKKLMASRAGSSSSASVKAPMPGRITKVLVTVGQEIQAGQGLAILEAMKMENEIRSPASGHVKSISVKDSDTVEKGELLAEIQ